VPKLDITDQGLKDQVDRGRLKVQLWVRRNGSDRTDFVPRTLGSSTVLVNIY